MNTFIDLDDCIDDNGKVTSSGEEEPIPVSGSGDQTEQEEDEAPETEIRDNSSSKEAAEDAGDTNSSPESEADKFQSSSINLSHLSEVLTLKRKIAELEKAILEKNQQIEELEMENVELQRIIQEFEAQQITPDDYVDSIEDFEPAGVLSNSSIC